MQSSRSSSDRHYGIDLLRLVATGMIIVHHMIGAGGLSAMFPRLSASDVFYHSVNIVCYCAVNLYGMISGYVGVGRRFRLSRLFELWLQMVFTGLAVTVAFAILADHPPTAKDWFSSLLPISFNAYWYCTAYVCMYIFLPAMHHALDHMSRRCYLATLASAFLLFCVLPLFSGEDTFRLVYGYHTLWLMVLYAAGYYFKRFGFGWLEKHAVPVYAGCMTIAILTRVLLETLDLHGIFSGLPITLMEKYTSPTLVIGSAALMALFGRISVTGWAERMIRSLSPMALGVYLIHVHPLIYNRLIAFCFTRFAGLPAVKLVLLFAAVCLGIYALCLALDRIRIQLFRIAGVRKRTEWLEAKLQGWYERIVP